jgi:hypothetical protein
MGNTGYKSFASLELYYTDDNSYAGATKANISTDPDYIAPILDTATCVPSARYYNVERTMNATKNDCSSGYAGSVVTLTANANQFVSALSIADANAQADLWLTANTQAYANTSGFCTLNPSITITSYSAGDLYFTLNGTGYSPTALTVNTSTTSSAGPWTNSTSGATSPRNVGVPTVTTWYRIQDANTPSILSNVYQYVIAGDTTAPTVCSLSQSYSAPDITLTWTAATDANGISSYDLQQNIDDTGWQSIYNGLTRIFTQSLDDGTQNTFRVIAYDTSGNYSISNQQSRTGPVACFVEGTLIALPDGTQMPIESLVLNQLLLSAEIESLNDTNDVNQLYKWSSDYLSENRITAPITKIEPKIAYETIVINEGLLEATPCHSQLIQRGGVWKFIPLGSVVVGDKLYGINKEIIEITAVLVRLEKRNIYPLTLSPSHIYFANGILTHNVKPIDN